MGGSQSSQEEASIWESGPRSAARAYETLPFEASKASTVNAPAPYSKVNPTPSPAYNGATDFPAKPEPMKVETKAPTSVNQTDRTPDTPSQPVPAIVVPAHSEQPHPAQSFELPSAPPQHLSPFPYAGSPPHYAHLPPYAPPPYSPMNHPSWHRYSMHPRDSSFYDIPYGHSSPPVNNDRHNRKRKFRHMMDPSAHEDRYHDEDEEFFVDSPPLDDRSDLGSLHSPPFRRVRRAKKPKTEPGSGPVEAVLEILGDLQKRVRKLEHKNKRTRSRSRHSSRGGGAAEVDAGVQEDSSTSSISSSP